MIIEAADQMNFSDEIPPGLSKEEAIAHLLGKVARQKYQLETMERRLNQSQDDNEKLRQLLKAIENSNGKHSKSKSPSDVTTGESLPLKKRKRSVDPKESNAEPPIKKPAAPISSLHSRLLDQLKSLRERIKIAKWEAEKMKNDCNEELKNIRYECRRVLEPVFVMEELVPGSSNSKGFMYVKKRDLTALLDTVTANMARMASDLQEHLYPDSAFQYPALPDHSAAPDAELH